MTDERLEEGVVSATADTTGLEIVRIFDAPRELVYEAWTEPERFGAWFGESVSTIPAVDLEDLGHGRTRMTFSQRGGSLPADVYPRAMDGWLIFFDRLGENVSVPSDARDRQDERLERSTT